MKNGSPIGHGVRKRDVSIGHASAIAAHLALALLQCSILEPDHVFTRRRAHSYDPGCAFGDRIAVRAILDANGLGQLSMEEVTTIGPDERVHGLHLRNRGIHTLPAIVGALGALRTLLLDSNDLVLLPQSMGGLLRLERLGLSHNDLSVLPDTLTALGIWIESTVCSGPCGSSDCCYTEYTNGLDVEGNRLCVVAARVAEWLDEHQPSWPATQRCGEPE